VPDIYTDPATGHRYRVDPATGQSVWVVDPAPPAPIEGPSPFPPIGGEQDAEWPAARGKKRHPVRTTVLAVAGVVALIAAIGAVASSGATSAGTPAAGGTSQPARTGPTAEPTASPPIPGVNAPVRDGKFEFTVTKVKPGVSTLGDDTLSTEAQGQFVLVTITVRNIGKEAQLFDGSYQYLFDADGREFEASSEAAAHLGKEANSFLNVINPGNATTGIVVFDIPKGVTLSRIELHDSMFSEGVEVSLA
jgi:hypothetical protein